MLSTIRSAIISAFDEIIDRCECKPNKDARTQSRTSAIPTLSDAADIVRFFSTVVNRYPFELLHDEQVVILWIHLAFKT